MKQQTSRPRFNPVTAFIAAALAKMALAKSESNTDNPETQSEFKYAGLGAFYGAPVYSPKRGKFKGYMRDSSYKAKRR